MANYEVASDEVNRLLLERCLSRIAWLGITNQPERHARKVIAWYLEDVKRLLEALDGDRPMVVILPAISEPVVEPLDPNEELFPRFADLFGPEPMVGPPITRPETPKGRSTGRMKRVIVPEGPPPEPAPGDTPEPPPAPSMEEDTGTRLAHLSDFDGEDDDPQV